MNTYEVEFKNNIGNRICFEVQAEDEPEARLKAYEEMESEGHCIDDLLSHGYFMTSIEQI